MNMLSSNLFQIGLTFLGGSLLYLVALFLMRRPVPDLPDSTMHGLWYSGSAQAMDFPVATVNLLSVAVSFSIAISFIFNLGEVYQYSDWYKRGFGYWDDGFPYILIFFLIVHAMTKSKWLFTLSVLILLMMGGKATLIASMISILAIALRFEECRMFIRQSWKYVGLAAILYFSAVSLSSSIIQFEWAEKFRNSTNEFFHHESVIHGKGACATYENCYNTQIKMPLKQRFFSSVGGLWMTLQGGYYGKRYPANPGKFADLMVSANPWGINDRFGLSWQDWYKMGQVQNPYLKFGSGYGYYGLAVLILFFGVLSFFAISNLRFGYEKPPWAAFSLFFLLMVTLNQTQSWIESGSKVLLLTGICSAHIFLTYARRIRAQLIQHQSMRQQG